MTRGTVGASVVGEFHKGDEFCPVVYLIIAEDAEILFQFLVDSFCLAICLWIKGDGHSRFDPQLVPDFLYDF